MRIIHLLIVLVTLLTEKEVLSRGIFVIQSEENREAEHNQTDIRLSLIIISTHWLEKRSLALISGRAGVWDKVHLANLNLQNTQRSNETLIV